MSGALALAFGLEKIHSERVEQHVQSMVDTLKTTGKSYMRGDHDVSGTPFFKVSASAKQHETNYTLDFACSGGYDLNTQLAKTLHLPQNLAEIRYSEYS